MKNNLHQLLLWARGTHLRYDSVLLRNLEMVMELDDSYVNPEDLKKRFNAKLDSTKRFHDYAKATTS